MKGCETMGKIQKGGGTTFDKAKSACINAKNSVQEHFVEVNKTSLMPNGGEKIIND